MPLPFFTHRPPTSKITLLSDPFPSRLNNTNTLFVRAEMLSSQREHIAASRGARFQPLTKK